MARQLVQATLPHTAPRGQPPEWSRQNGNLTLAIRPGYKTDRATGKRVCLGYPYGTIPRLVLFWITTEALRTRSARLELGASLAGFMRALGLNPDNGSIGAKRSDARRLREQMERLFRATISFEITEAKSQRWLDMQIAPEGEMWWDFHDPAQQGLWLSWIELNPRFFQAITNAPVPVDMRALRALKRSPLALDLYAWVSYRAFVAAQSGRTQFVTWEQLMGQLGTDYVHVQHFRAKAKAALRKIQAVYPGLLLGGKQGGIEILPGASAVPPKRSQRKALPAVDQAVIRDETVSLRGDETVSLMGDETVSQPIERLL
jgi:Plasmid encoded RepA protein